MSIAKARDALLTRLGSITDPWPTAYENIDFEPPVNASWQAAKLIVDGPFMVGAGAEAVEEWKGFLQVSLFTPRGNSASEALLRADSLRDHFRRSLQLTDDGFTLTITNVQIHTGMNEDRYYHLPVSIYWQAYTLSALP